MVRKSEAKRQVITSRRWRQGMLTL